MQAAMLTTRMSQRLGVASAFPFMESVPTSRAVHYINTHGSTLVMRSPECDCALILTYVACIRSHPINNTLEM